MAGKRYGFPNISGISVHPSWSTPQHAYTYILAAARDSGISLVAADYGDDVIDTHSPVLRCLGADPGGSPRLSPAPLNPKRRPCRTARSPWSPRALASPMTRRRVSATAS